MIIIQARSGSKRFPNKIAAQLGGKSVLAHVMDRCKRIKMPAEYQGLGIVVAAPKNDYSVYDLAKPLGARVFWGSETDLIERYLGAAKCYGFDPIMRITSDCPFLQPDLCRKVLDLYLDGGCSYSAIGWPKTYPKGYGCEVFSLFALELANVMATDPYDREHVTPWMERNLRCKYLTQDKDESHLNFCVDEPGDIARLEGELG